LAVTGGTQIYIGWQRDTGTLFDWSWAGDSAAVAYKTASDTPSNFGGTASPLPSNGSIGAYATYTAGGTGNGPRIYRGGVWKSVTWKIYRAGDWVPVQWKMRRGGAWVNLT
jgi:hypothetical protein